MITIIDSTVIASALLAIIGGLASLISAYISSRRRPQQDGETTQQRIDRLTESLSESVGLISQVEEEIKSRHALAQKLQKDVETYETITKLKKPEVEAVTQLLRGELREEGHRSFRSNVIVNFVFFVFGVIVTIILISFF